jgi:hypothetical protein
MIIGLLAPHFPLATLDSQLTPKSTPIPSIGIPTHDEIPALCYTYEAHSTLLQWAAPRPRGQQGEANDLVPRNQLIVAQNMES